MAARLRGLAALMLSAAMGMSLFAGGPAQASHDGTVDDACPVDGVPGAGFADVAASNVHAPAIDCVVWWEIANGTSATTYAPTAAVNRAQMASFIARLLDASGQPLPTASQDHFSDDAANAHEANINRLAEAGIVGGLGGGRYGPAQSVSRAQMASFLVRAHELRTGDLLGASRDNFVDDDGNVHEPNIDKAAEAGFTGGKAPGVYDPAAAVTRGQMASFLARVVDALVEAGLSAPPGEPGGGDPVDPPAEPVETTCAGIEPTILGTDGPDRLTGTDGPDVILALGGDDTIDALGADDLVCAGPGIDLVLGGDGADTVDGGPDADEIEGGPGGDILLGGDGDDFLSGQADFDALLGGPGDDWVDGGDDIDIAAYLGAPAPAVVDLSTGWATGDGEDVLDAVEGVMGSDHADELLGGDDVNMFFPGGGDDFIDGRAGSDFVFYGLAPAGVHVDLAGGVAVGDGTDTLESVENAVGSPHDDVLVGDDGPNYLSGDAGTDSADGRGGDNLCYAEATTSCTAVLPTTTEPPDSVPAAAAAVRAAADPPPSVEAFQTFPGSLDCPALQGAAWLAYPAYTGYGYFAWRTSYPWPVGAWNYGPWVYFDGSQRIIHYAGTWWPVTGPAVFPGGHHTFIEAWWFHHGSGTWYEVGECQTSTWHLIPGMTVVPR